MHTLKVRDRTTGKIREAMVDSEDYARLKQYEYMTDKNSEEPFREVIANGKRPRIALKRDVMGFELGDPRRVCYVDKTQLFDCRKSNLKVKTEGKAMVKIVKTTVGKKKEKEKETTTCTETPVVVVTPDTTTETVVEVPATTTTTCCNTTLDVKRALSTQIESSVLVETLLDKISVDDLLDIIAKNRGYEKKSA